MAEPRRRPFNELVSDDLGDIMEEYRTLTGDNRSQFRRDVVAVMASTARGAIEGAGFARAGPAVVPAAVAGAVLFGSMRAGMIGLSRLGGRNAMAAREAMDALYNFTPAPIRVAGRMANAAVLSGLLFGAGRLAGVVPRGTALGRVGRFSLASGVGEAVATAIEEGDRRVAGSRYDPVRVAAAVPGAVSSAAGASSRYLSMMGDSASSLLSRAGSALDIMRGGATGASAGSSVRRSAGGRAGGGRTGDSMFDGAMPLGGPRGFPRPRRPEPGLLETIGDAARRNILEPAIGLYDRVEREAARMIVQTVVPDTGSLANTAIRTAADYFPRRVLRAGIGIARAHPERTAEYVFGRGAGDMVRGARELGTGVSETFNALANFAGDRLRAGVRSFRGAQMEARAAVANALQGVNLEAERAVSAASGLAGSASRTVAGAAGSVSDAASGAIDLLTGRRLADPRVGDAMARAYRNAALEARMDVEEREIVEAERARSILVPRAGRVPGLDARMMLGGSAGPGTDAVVGLRNEQRAALEARRVATAGGDRDGARAASRRFREASRRARERIGASGEEPEPLLREWQRRGSGGRIHTVRRRDFWR